MKNVTLLLASFCVVQFSLAQQDSKLIGTWMEKTDSLKEVKLISSKHVFFIVSDAKQDTLMHAGAGEYTTTGNKYTEKIKYATWDADPSGYTFDYSVTGDKFMQKGVMTMPDGSKASINHTFMRTASNNKKVSPMVGVWNQLSTSWTTSEGEKGSQTNATHIRYQLNTPTHWMRISEANGKFENAFGGTYTIEGNVVHAKVEYGTKNLIGFTADLTQRVEGNKLYWSGPVKDASGKVINNIEDVFERVE